MPDSAPEGRIRPQNHEPDSRGRPMDGFLGRIGPQNHERFPKPCSFLAGGQGQENSPSIIVAESVQFLEPDQGQESSRSIQQRKKVWRSFSCDVFHVQCRSKKEPFPENLRERAENLNFNGKLFGSRLGSADGRKANIQLLTSLFVKKRKANTWKTMK